MAVMSGFLKRSQIRSFFTPRWIITTLLVFLVAAIMIRLGFWQLDRLQQRRAFNARVEAQINAAPLNLNEDLPLDGLTDMEYRQVTVRGVYDAQNEVLLRNQIYDGQPGYRLLTPLHISGTDQSVLVDRGFIPQEEKTAQDRAKYLHNGEQEINGVIRLEHVPKYFGAPDPTLAPGQARLEAWNAMNLTRMQEQIPYAVLPVYIQAADQGKGQTEPIAMLEEPDLSEGPHMGYAMQWFAFTAVLLLGYPFFLRRFLK